MCFSAGASFAVSASLVAPGYFSISQARNRGMLLFACTPLLFSFHQAAEGMIWLSLTDPDFTSWYKPALYGYSFISQPIWPVWAPLTMWLMEPDEKRKKLISWFLILGIASALYMFYCLISYPIRAVAEHGHIRYYRAFPHLTIMRPLNFITIAISPFLSTLRYSKLLAAAMLLSLIMTYFFFTSYLISVWCFFAAILSLLVILVVRANR
ncbi:DUF6629 family protein [Flavihumibacter petaseus]|uniref:DUF6629 family protein n=1 Tax=Flavihumibacter petaseus TaxID=549295 RepID=UPI0012FA48C8|nr:DUF6629 family protein [Flavihumibacter petaseus]